MSVESRSRSRRTSDDEAVKYVLIRQYVEHIPGAAHRFGGGADASR
ncbi:hypothetical protein [Gordonia westfalica]|nr:hypothetical protein [Gordonia westfalica]